MSIFTVACATFNCLQPCISLTTGLTYLSGVPRKKFLAFLFISFVNDNELVMSDEGIHRLDCLFALHGLFYLFFFISRTSVLTILQ